MKKIAFGAAVAASWIALTGTALAQRSSPVILVVDSGRLLSDCTSCRAANAHLQWQQTIIEQRQQQLDQQQQRIRDAMSAAGGKLPDDALQRWIALYENELHWAREMRKRRQQLESTEAHVHQQISHRLREILEQIRAQRNAAVVVAKGETWASHPAIDVTNEALTALNQQLPFISMTPLPQAIAPAAPPQQQPQAR